MFDNFKLQHHLRDRPDLTLREKAVAFVLTTYRNQTNGACFPSQERLAKTLSCSRKHINTIVQSLKNKGVLRLKKQRVVSARKRTVNNYVFLYDENGAE